MSVLSRKSKGSPKINLLILFILSLLIHGIISVYMGEYAVFYDELQHNNLAKAIASGDFFEFRGASINFFEILYSVVISPVYMIFDNTAYAHTIIIWVNAFLISSAIFPIYLMSSKLLKSRVHIWMVTIYGTIIAETYYSAFVIQENLNYPVIMWFFCLLVYFFSSDYFTLRRSIGLGCYTFLLTTIKSVNLAIFVAVCICFLYMLVFEQIEKKQILKAFISYIATHLILQRMYAAIAAYIAGTGDNHQVTNALARITGMEYILTLGYAFALYMVFSMLATGIFQIPILSAGFMHLEHRIKRLVVFCFSYIIVVSGTVCLLFVPTENYGDLAIRSHTRYFFYGFVMLFLLFFNWYEGYIYQRQKHIPWATEYILMGFATAIAILPIIPGNGSNIDSISLNYLRLFQSNQVLPLLLKVLLIIFIVVGLILLHKRYFKQIVMLTVLFLVLISVSGTALEIFPMFSYKNSASVQASKEDAQAINQYWQSQNLPKDDADRLCIVGPGTEIVGDAVLESYLWPQYHYIQGATLLERWREDGALDFSKINLFVRQPLMNQTLENSPEYLLTKSQNSLVFSGYEEVPLELTSYVLYQKISDEVNISQSHTGISTDSWVSQDAQIYMAGDENAAYGTVTLEVSNILFDHEVEVSYTDGMGNSGIFSVPNNGGTSLVTLEVQKSVNNIYEISLHAEEAVQPNNGDTRYLSFRIHNFNLVSERK